MTQKAEEEGRRKKVEVRRQKKRVLSVELREKLVAVPATAKQVNII